MPSSFSSSASFPPTRCGLPDNPFIYSYFALSLEGLKHGFVWQLLTYQFMHGGLFHILLNGWAIYVFGRAMEETLGPGNS